MLRPSNERESAAFHLVERTLRKARPRVGARGLESLIVPKGTIERGSLGRLRFRFDGRASDYEPENGPRTRALSDTETNYWIRLRNMVTVARPIADSEWNLLSMHLGPRVLRRLPTGRVVTYEPNDRPRPETSLDSPLTGMLEELDQLVASPSAGEAELLAAIDAFLQEIDAVPSGTQRKVNDANRARAAARRSMRWANLGASAPFVRGRHRARGKWHKCPICRTPVVKGRFNPRIPVGLVRPGGGSIRDLRGGFLSRLRETYLVADPASLIELADSQEEIATGLWPEPGPGDSAGEPRPDRLSG